MKPIKVIIYIKVKFLGGIKMKLKKVLAFSISALLFSLSISNYESVFSYAESTPELSDNNSTVKSQVKHTIFRQKIYKPFATKYTRLMRDGLAVREAV